MLRIRRIKATDSRSARQQVRALGSDAVILSIHGGEPSEYGDGARVNSVEIVAGVPVQRSAEPATPNAPLVSVSPAAANYARTSKVLATAEDVPEAPAVLSFSELLRKFSAPGGSIAEVEAYVAPAGLRPAAEAGRASADGVDDAREPAGDRTRTAVRAAERAFDVLRAIGLGEEIAERALEDAVRNVPAKDLVNCTRLIDRALSGLLRELQAGPCLSALGLPGKAVVFVGATGTGKTSALLKAALHLRGAGVDVTVVGADGSRPGAREQLLACCMAHGLPVTIADGPSDLARIVESESRDGVVFIDVPAGFPPGGADRAQEGGEEAGIGTLLAALAEPLVVITVPASLPETELHGLAATARAVGASAVAITKLDELCFNTASSGAAAAFNIVAQLRLPPLLCGTGRDVGRGIRVLSPTELVLAAIDAMQQPARDPESVIQ